MLPRQPDDYGLRLNSGATGGGTVKKEDPTWAIGVLLPQALRCRVTRVRSTAPSQHMLAQHVEDFVVSP